MEEDVDIRTPTALFIISLLRPAQDFHYMRLVLCAALAIARRLNQVKSIFRKLSRSDLKRHLGILFCYENKPGLDQIISLTAYIVVRSLIFFSNTAAAVATMIETKVVTIHMARKPAGSSSLL